MNYGELKTLVRNYIHDTSGSTTDDMIPDFIELTHEVINREVRGTENMSSTTFTPTAVTHALPADFVEALELSYMKGAHRQIVRFTSRAGLAQWVGQTGNQVVASIYGSTIEIQPSPIGTEFTLIYWNSETFFPGDASENDWLTNHPRLYLYGALNEAYTYLQDDPRRDQAGRVFYSEIERINAMAKKDRYGRDLVIEGVA